MFANRLRWRHSHLVLKPVLDPDTKVNFSSIPSLGMGFHNITRRHDAASYSGLGAKKNPRSKFGLLDVAEDVALHTA
ncbi:uncharacterized protein PG986_006336 [Apiospora aurea]|uniref:Uncharacterized protein n=1 Tax=Apiospora aurea TaxID=335848 RepID=A0ABR1QK45_9PEZI